MATSEVEKEKKSEPDVNRGSDYVNCPIYLSPSTM